MRKENGRHGRLYAYFGTGIANAEVCLDLGSKGADQQANAHMLEMLAESIGEGDSFSEQLLADMLRDADGAATISAYIRYNVRGPLALLGNPTSN
jgi:hypothetical protein